MASTSTNMADPGSRSPRSYMRFMREVRAEEHRLRRLNNNADHIASSSGTDVVMQGLANVDRPTVPSPIPSASDAAVGAKPHADSIRSPIVPFDEDSESDSDSDADSVGLGRTNETSSRVSSVGNKQGLGIAAHIKTELPDRNIQDGHEPQNRPQPRHSEAEPADLPRAKTLLASRPATISSKRPSTDAATEMPRPNKKAKANVAPLATATPAAPTVPLSSSTNSSRSGSVAPAAQIASATGSIPKKKQRRSSAAETIEGDEAASELPDLVNATPPAWYARLNRSQSRGKGLNNTSTADALLGEIKSAIRRSKSAKNDRGRAPADADLLKLIDGIHQAMFLPMIAQTCRNNYMLTAENGLPQIFSPHFNEGVVFPYYIVADAAELYTKWFLEIFDTNLFRGILMGKKENLRLNRKGEAAKLDPAYPRRLKGDFHGNGSLINGQWWPAQLCALRDGAHHSAQGGIAGKSGEGAWSIIVAGDVKYDDKDEGEELLYCGTEGKDGQVSENTQRLIENVNLKLPVRVIRSERCKNPKYRLAKGYRYDGLYDVLGHELLNVAKQIHRFRMVRQAGQDPIRYSGPEVRPTMQELAAYDKAQSEKEFLV